MKKVEWFRIDKTPMCVRCKKEATHTFKKITLFHSEKKEYCDEHLLERIKEENVY